MPAYSLHQIILSDELRDLVNSRPATEPVEYTNYCEALVFGRPEKAIAAGQYKQVAQIEARDLDHVFEIGNIGPEERIIHLAPMRSISVGDIIGSPDGKFHVVASFGFDPVEFEDKRNSLPPGVVIGSENRNEPDIAHMLDEEQQS